MDVDEINQNSKKVGRAQMIVTIVAVLAVIFIALTYKDSQKNGEIDTNDKQTSVDTSWPSNEVDKAVIDESTKYYDIKVNYPVVKDKTISLLFKDFAEKQINQFKQDTSWVNDPEISSASEGELSISIDYQKTVSANTETYVFTTGTYTGGAHGMQYTTTMTFNKLGKMLKITDLFSNPDAGLKLVSDYVKAELMKGEFADAGAIDAGASPTADNYQSFIITNQGLTVIFDPYQVAPYAAGIPRVDVPLSVFKSVVNKNIF
jgi:hypothetical protein